MMKMMKIIMASIFRGFPICQLPWVALTFLKNEKKKRQIVMSEAEYGVGGLKTLETDIGLFAGRQQAKLS